MANVSSIGLHSCRGRVSIIHHNDGQNHAPLKKTPEVDETDDAISRQTADMLTDDACETGNCAPEPIVVSAP